MRSGVGLLMMKPGLERSGRDLGRHRLAEVEADQEPGAAHLGDALVPGQPSRTW